MPICREEMGEIRKAKQRQENDLGASNAWESCGFSKSLPLRLQKSCILVITYLCLGDFIYHTLSFPTTDQELTISNAINLIQVP
jgi:hypothetical protein